MLISFAIRAGLAPSPVRVRAMSCRGRSVVVVVRAFSGGHLGERRWCDPTGPCLQLGRCTMDTQTFLSITVVSGLVGAYICWRTLASRYRRPVSGSATETTLLRQI